MLNNFMVVGRINNIDLKNDICVLTIRIPRSFKNKDGEYEEDLISVQVFGSLRDTLKEYCDSGDLIGVKGRIQNSNILVAEKISFLSSKQKKDSEN